MLGSWQRVNGRKKVESPWTSTRSSLTRNLCAFLRRIKLKTKLDGCISEKQKVKRLQLLTVNICDLLTNC